MDIYEKNNQQFGFSPTQKKILELVGKDKTILEIGSSAGYMTKEFIKNGCLVDVVEINEQSFKKVSQLVKVAFNGSVEDPKIVSLFKEKYDFIIMADVLEHLVNPKQALKNLSRLADAETQMLISLPNVAGWAMRKQLFFQGDFEYQESGLLDKTHLRFFTVNTLPKFLRENGWKTREMIGTVTRLPLEGIISRIPIMRPVYFTLFREGLTQKYKNLAFDHFLVIVQKV